MRRKTSAITLTMLAGVSIAFTGCLDEEENPRLAKSEGDCTTQLNDPEGCHNAVIQAQKDFERQAPRFANKSDCDPQFGAANCDHGGETAATRFGIFSCLWKWGRASG